MAVVIRMKRTGRRNRPCYRISVADSRCPRDGNVLENLGLYDPVSPIRQVIGFGGGMCDTDASDDGNGCVENRVNLDDHDHTSTAHKGP